MSIDTVADPTCPRHPTVATLLSCTRCERPACPDCLVHGAVGAHCVDCLAGQRASLSPAERRVERVEARMRRPGLTFWALLAAFIAGCVACAIGPEVGTSAHRLVGFATLLAGWIVSLCLHEYAHAVTAYRFGDHSVAEKGYLTLNPLRYSDPLMSVVLPVGILLLGGIAFPGGAVWIDESRIRGKARRAAVSLAGPMANLLFAAIILIPLGLGLYGSAEGLVVPLAFLGALQIVSAVINLLPIPGLDGYGIIEHYLPVAVQRALRGVQMIGFVILLILLSRTDLGTEIWTFALETCARVDVDPTFVILADELLLPDLTGGEGS